MYKTLSRFMGCRCRNSNILNVDAYLLRPSLLLNKTDAVANIGYVFKRTKKHDRASISSLFVPVPVKPSPDDINVGAEFTGKLKKQDLVKTLNNFYQQKELHALSADNGIDDELLYQAFKSFQRHCLQHDLPPDLHIIISDIVQGAGHVMDLFPYFLRYVKQAYPHLDCMDDLKKISDLRNPASWYPSARNMQRKIVFHAGPTNSGKTYHALQRFLHAKSGIYCGPLKMLAAEIYHKSNQMGTPCDLVTGEERRQAKKYQNIAEVIELDSAEIDNLESEDPSSHVACTVEMTSLNIPYEVAIIDEIQMIADRSRGWAWTRAVLGLQAEEIHLCGEAGAISLIEELCNNAGEELEVRTYKRLTGLQVENQALNSLDNVQPGDCIVCFNKNDIYHVSREIEKRGREVAVIYGSLPPGTKLAQANKFNDPESPCKVMVATDAIGLGINLSIRRIIFYSLIKPVTNEKGDNEMDVITISQALQIAGRAGRYGSTWEEGFVTCYKSEDLPTLKTLMASLPEPVTKAGLHPTAEQMELYAYHLPHASLSSLMDIFVHLCTVDDSLYFMCNTKAFKFLAEMIQHVPLPLRERYIFCCAPINQKVPFVCAMFLKIVRQYSRSEPITKDWVCEAVGWPCAAPKTIMDLVHLEAVFDVLDLYLWLSYRFLDLFPDAKLVREMQGSLDIIIQRGIFQITRLLQNTRAAMNAELLTDEDYSQAARYKRRSRSKSDEEPRSGNENRGGKLSEILVAKGLLTPRMLKRLQDELVHSENREGSSKLKTKKPITRRKK